MLTNTRVLVVISNTYVHTIRNTIHCYYTSTTVDHILSEQKTLSTATTYRALAL